MYFRNFSHFLDVNYRMNCSERSNTSEKKECHYPSSTRPCSNLQHKNKSFYKRHNTGEILNLFGTGAALAIFRPSWRRKLLDDGSECLPKGDSDKTCYAGTADLLSSQVFGRSSRRSTVKPPIEAQTRVTNTCLML